MHVIQSQLTNYSYQGRVQTQIKLVRWWILESGSVEGKELALPFTNEQEAIFIQFMDDHPANFPKEKRERFHSNNLVLPHLGFDDRDADIENPCILLLRAKPSIDTEQNCRRMDIVLLNNQFPIQLPFDVAGEIVLEKV